MQNYYIGESVTIEGTNGKKITWIATGDPQRDAAIEIQIKQAVECLDWTYVRGGTNIDNKIVDCSGLTSYLYSLVDVNMSATSRTDEKVGLVGQYEDENGEQIFSLENQSYDDIDWDSVPTGSILTFGSKGGHVGYYLGNGYFIHALSSKYGVVISSIYDRKDDEIITTDEITGKIYTENGMEILSKKAYSKWDSGQEPFWYITTFDSNIYVDENGEIYHTISGENESFYRPVDKIGDEIIYELVDKNNQVKEKGFFDGNEFVDYTILAITESVNATNLPQHEKDRIIEQMIKVFTSTKPVIGTIDPISDKVSGKYLGDVKTQVLKAKTTKVDPIIFDLDGDGFNIETKENGAYFDLDKNEFAEKINWTTKDGFLCLDLNNNGSIDNGGELFGDQTLLADGTEAANGFEALAQYDSNSDGVIDANDEIFDSLRVWVDSDGSGTSEAGELKTLADLGIVSINLGYETINGETGTEATIGNASTFTYADGTIGNIGELWVSSDLFDTVDDLDIEIPDDIKDLPNVGSIGNVYSLHNAMVLDETGELKALVESFAAEQDADKRMELAEQILFFITGADDVADGSRGAYMDAKQLSVIEALLGENYVGTSGKNPNSAAAPLLKEAYNDLLNMYYCELAAQTHIKDYVQLLRYTENEDGTKTLNDDLLNYLLEYQLANGDENAKGILADVARYIQYLDIGGINGFEAFLINYAAISMDYASIIGGLIGNCEFADGVNPFEGSSSAELILGTDSEDTIYGKNGNDTLIGGKGDDYLNGAAGNDTYIFNIGDGNDVIEDYYANTSYSRKDKIVFGEGISIDDIIFTKSGNDFLISFTETEDPITITNHNSSSYNRVENFTTSNGYMIDYSKINQLIQAMASFEANTGMNWADAVEQGNETANSIISGMWVKSVS